MKHPFLRPAAKALAIGVATFFPTDDCAWAQSGAMWNSGYPANGLPLDKISLYYQPVVPARQPQKQDIITVVVNLKREFVSDGKVQRQKRSNVQAKLSDWFLLRDGSLKPGLQDGSPSIQGTLNTQFRTQNNMENLDLMRFTIAAKVADVRPNGNLVIEAHQTIRNNNEIWEQSLTGVIRPEDLLPGNRVLSENVAEMSVVKLEQGHQRDSNRRGWFMRFWDFASPF